MDLYERLSPVGLAFNDLNDLGDAPNIGSVSDIDVIPQLEF